MRSHLCVIAFLVACASAGCGITETKDGGEVKHALGEDKADVDCWSAKFEYCVEEMGLDEATCKAKVAAWCKNDEK